MSRRGFLLVTLVVLLLGGTVTGAFLLGRGTTPRVEQIVPTVSPLASPSLDPDPMECRRAALQLRSLLRDWRTIWDPVFEAAREETITAKRWRRSASRFSVLEARIETLVVPSELKQAHALAVRSTQGARDLLESLAEAEQTGEIDERSRARALGVGDRARELWIAADRNLDRHPCSR